MTVLKLKERPPRNGRPFASFEAATSYCFWPTGCNKAPSEHKQSSRDQTPRPPISLTWACGIMSGRNRLACESAPLRQQRARRFGRPSSPVHRLIMIGGQPLPVFCEGGEASLQILVAESSATPAPFPEHRFNSSTEIALQTRFRPACLFR